MRSFALIVLVTAALSFSGCSDSTAGPSAEVAPAAVYRSGHGVQLSPAAREFVQLATAEVGAAADGAELPAVPEGALLRSARGDFVYVENGDYFLRTPVTAGASRGGHVEISDGLYEGDVVVVSGVRALALSEIQALNGGVGCADGH